MTTLRVPSEYGSIEAAQNAASEGDTILLAPGTYNPPLAGIFKPIHLKGDTASVGNVIVEATAVGASNPAHRTALPYAIVAAPALSVLYVEGILFRPANGIGGAGNLFRPFSLFSCNSKAIADLEFLVNRCALIANGANTWDFITYYQRNSRVRLRNCNLASALAEGNDIDAGELHVERCYLSSSPWTFTASTKSVLDTADYVSVATPEYGHTYGEWLAPWFMGDTFRYAGRVRLDGVPPGIAIRLLLAREATGLVIAETESDSASGVFSFEIPAAEAQNQHILHWLPPAESGYAPGTHRLTQAVL